MTGSASVVDAQTRRDIVSAVRQYVAEKVVPVATEMERDHVFPDKLLSELASLGLFGMNIPTAYNGLGLDLVTRSLVFRELAYGWMSLSGIIASHSVVAGTIASSGTEEQRETYLPAMNDGSLLGALSLSEPHAGSDTRSITCRATSTDEGFVINGLKTWVTNGYRAGVVLLAAKTEDDKVSLFIIADVEKAKAAGTISTSKPFDKLGSRGTEVVEMAYTNHHVPHSALLGGDDGMGRGLPAILAQLDIGRINIANVAAGISQAAFDAANRYAAERTAFGQTINNFQGIEFKLAEMATKVYASQLMASDVAARHDAGEEVGIEAAMAKFFCSEAALEVSLDAMRVHGGAGYVSDFPVERFFRDAPLMAIGEGTNEIQKMVIARALKRTGIPRGA